MLMRLLQRYSLKLVFALTLLVGLQIPNFLQQYEHRLDAHYIEAKNQLNEYRELARRYSSGDLQALIAEHKNSALLLFRAEAPVIEKLLNRFNYLQEKKNGQQGPLVRRLYFLLVDINSPLMQETRENYNAEIVLNQDSIAVGLVSALICTLLLELLFLVTASQARRLCYYFSLKLN